MSDKNRKRQRAFNKAAATSLKVADTRSENFRNVTKNGGGFAAHHRKGGKDFTKAKKSVHVQYLSENEDRVLQAMKMMEKAAIEGYFEVEVVDDKGNPTGETHRIVAEDYDQRLSAIKHYLHATVGQPSKDQDSTSFAMGILAVIRNAQQGVQAMNEAYNEEYELIEEGEHGGPAGGRDGDEPAVERLDAEQDG